MSGPWVVSKLLIKVRKELVFVLPLVGSHSLLMNRTKGSIKSILFDIVMQIKYIDEKENHFVALTTDHESDWV
jgi:hypothetical protein